MKQAFLSLFFPKYCVHCGNLLLPDEEVMCLVCQSQLPRVYAGKRGNAVELQVFGRIQCEYATSFFYYTKETSELLKEAKYRHHPWINRHLARLFATELNIDGWPHDIDVIVPVPIHWRRRLARGYNQAYYVALGLSEVWHLPILDLLRKSRYTTTQVQQQFEQRLEHVRGSFCVRHPEKLSGKHVLLVDDVFTSGATLEACAIALREACPDIRISILTLAFAHL